MVVAHFIKAIYIGFEYETIEKFWTMVMEQDSKEIEVKKCGLLKILYSLLIWPIEIIKFENKEEPELFKAYKEIEESY